MRTIVIATLLLCAVPAGAKPSDADVKAAMKSAEVFASAQLDDENRARLLFQSCSEIAGCAAGCQKPLEACAKFDPSVRARLLVLSQDQCPAIDFKAQHDKDKKLTPEQWMEGYFKKFLDAVAPLVPKTDREMWWVHRKKAKL